MPIKPLHTIPTFAQKAVDGAGEGHQSNYPHQGAWKKPILTSAQAKRVDALGIKFEDESIWRAPPRKLSIQS